MKKYFLKNIISLSIAFSTVLIPCFSDQAPSSRPLVAITQIAPHPSLDLIRKGIEDELADQKLTCEIQFKNAQGNIATATQIAQKFVSEKPTVIVPITTPSAQTVYAAATPFNIPVVFAAISDPVAAKLVPNLDQAGKGITGVCDLAPVAEQVALIQAILPQATRIGVVFNPGETNNIAVLDRFEKILTQKGLTLVKATATNTTEVATAAKSLVEKVDAIYIANDNTVVTALEALLKIAKEKAIPVFCSDPESVERGCLAAATYSQYGLGRQTGKMVAKVLQGADIQTMPVEMPAAGPELPINRKIAKTLKISIPINLEEQIKVNVRQNRETGA